MFEVGLDLLVLGLPRVFLLFALPHLELSENVGRAVKGLFVSELSSEFKWRFFGQMLSMCLMLGLVAVSWLYWCRE